jgi:hypothetical protein
LEFLIVYIFIIIFSVIYIIYKKLKESKSDIKCFTLPLLISDYSDNSGKIICLPKYLYKNNEFVKKALIWKWLKKNGNNVIPNEPFVELLIGRAIFNGTINYYGKLFITRQKNENINGGSELCRLFLSDEKYNEYYKESIDNNYKQEFNIDKYSCVLEMPFIDGKKASSVKITKWYKKSGDYVFEKEIIGYHIINDCIEGIDHALKTGVIQIFKSENEYLKEGELVYEINAENLPNKSIHISDFNLTPEYEPQIVESENKTESNNNLQISKEPLIQKESDEFIHEIASLNSDIITTYKTETQLTESENKTASENITPQISDEITENKIITDNKIESETEKIIPNDLIDVSNYDTQIKKDENENKIKDVLINTNGDVIENSQNIEVRPKKEILEIIKNDLINIKKYNNQTPGISEEKNDDVYPKNNHELQSFWLKLPRKYQNTFTGSIKLSDKLIDDIYLKIINIYNELFKKNGTDIFRALKLTNKRILALEKIRDEEIKQGYNNYYYNDTQYYNNILNIFYYTHRTAQTVLKLKYNFQVNIENNFFILNDLGLEKYKEEIKSSLINLIQSIPDPDEETDIVINKLNTIRWKIYFNNIKEKKNRQNNKEEILNSIRKLIKQNKQNCNLKNIYYNSARLIFDINIMESTYYYAIYKILSKKSDVEAKPIPSSLKKKLLIYGNGLLIEYESILASIYNLNTKRDSKKLYNDVQRLFVKERKTIDIDKNKVLVAEEEHIRVKNKLDKILSAEEQTIINEEKMHNNKLVGDNITKTTGANLIDDIHKTLIHNIIKKGNSISEKDLMEYAYLYKLPHNLLVNTINEYFYERIEDNLIYEENSVFILNTEYINEITKLINND